MPLCCFALSGCHGRAYNDVYLENLATEIRGLEDQLYEYDHEYRILEQELASLRRENQRLQSSSTQTLSKPARPPIRSQQQPLPFQPRNGELFVPGPIEEVMPKSILEPDSIQIDPGISDNSTDSTGETAPPASSPFPASDLPAPGGSRSGNSSSGDFNAEELLPPTIEPGEPMPPPLPVMLESIQAKLAPEDSLEMNLSRIEIPAQLTGHATDNRATISIATEKVTDRRVVELAFHPSLSRAANFDDNSDDDGLYLVLQPRNERGQMVAEVASLTVLILDPARTGDAARIGQWDYSAEEVRDKLQPIGTSQGIHLTLPWNGPDPKADRVIVFATYTFENGRQVIGQKEIYVSTTGSTRTVWAPRGTDGTMAQAVADSPANATPNHVVRPASATAPAQPPSPPQQTQSTGLSHPNW
ncbi:MAG: hypothetical protein R3C53_10125 [Pirellulaceae bacterium]